MMLMMRRAALRSKGGIGEPEKEGPRRADDAMEAGGNNTGGGFGVVCAPRVVVESEKPRRGGRKGRGGRARVVGGRASPADFGGGRACDRGKGRVSVILLVVFGLNGKAGTAYGVRRRKKQLPTSSRLAHFEER